MKIRSFRDLDVWNLGKEIVVDIYNLTKQFPKEEIFCIVAQLRRAAISIPSNIAEGFNRYQNKEYRRFLFISLSSCAELETQIEISSDLQFISQDERRTVLEKIDHESRMLTNLIKKLDNPTMQYEQRTTSNERRNNG